MSKHWTITIQGTGDHHNSRDDDANRLAERFVDDLRQAGHKVNLAYFVHKWGRDKIYGQPKTVVSALTEPVELG